MKLQPRKCRYCDSPGGFVTYQNQIGVVIGGKPVPIDFCIATLIGALNAGGIRTLSSCCGHGRMPGFIELADGRSLAITPTRRSDDGIIAPPVIAPEDWLAWNPEARKPEGWR